MIEKEKIVSRIKGNGWLFAFLAFLLSLIPIIKALLGVLGGIMAKMTSDIFLGIVGIILLLGAIISFILWIRQRWANRVREKEEEIGTLKTRVEEKTKQYDELDEKTKPPSNVITIREYKIAKLVRGEVSKYPSLRFSLEVINRSYTSFKPERVEIACYNEGEKVGEDYWEKSMEKGAFGYDSAKEYISVSTELAGYGEGSINFEVPIEKEYEHLESWDLRGYVKYTDGEKAYVAKINTEHYLSKRAEEDLERKLKEAIGKGK